MSQQFHPHAGLRFTSFVAFWLPVLLIFTVGGDSQVYAREPEPQTETQIPEDHYQKQLMLRETMPITDRFWRKHRSYPHLDKALRLSREGRTDEALDVYDQYLEADPHHILMHWNRLVLLSATQPLKE